jgi:chitinase
MQFTKLVALSLAAFSSFSAVACGGGSGGGSDPNGAGGESTQAPADQSQSQTQGLAAATGATEYAPYFYSWGFNNSHYAFSSLMDMKAKTGTNAVTLAFVKSDGTCTPTHEIRDNQADVDAFVNSGGHVKASFGGLSGTYLEVACVTASRYATAIDTIVTETNLKDLDFDVEQAVAMTPAMNKMRGEAIASVQRAKGIKVSFTLAAVPRSTSGKPGGMSAESLAVVKAALDAGVKISHVNLMTMDYGASYSTGRTMGDLAISAVTDGAAQMRTLIPGLTEAQSFAMMGATPMIGRNDIPTETFTVADAQKLSSFAKAKGLGLLAMWAIQRDQPCPSGGDLAICSQAQSTKFAFDKALKSAL